MSQVILVINAGSSTVKVAAYVLENGELRADPLTRATLHMAANAVPDVWARIAPALAGRELIAVGHRIVHGGKDFTSAVVVTPEVEQRLVALIPLAPLHQPQGLALLQALRRKAPSAVQVACFDTAFHRTMPELAQLFALPRMFFDAGIRSYGFHGLSYEYIAACLPSVLAGRPQGRVVVAHLGNGSSLCALRNLQSVATTMTFTPLDGLPMATRCGSIDPGVLLYLATERRMPIADLTELLSERSGLLGVSQVSGDVRVLLESADSRAALALDLLVYRIGREIGAMAAALGGLDALVFTGGIGENAAGLRRRILENMAWLGVEFDAERNESGGPRLTSDASRVSAWRLPTDEEVVIARHTTVLARRGAIAVPTDTVGLRPGL